MKFRLLLALALVGGVMTHAHAQTYPGQFPATTFFGSVAGGIPGPVVYAPSATTDTTNASNITSNTLAANRGGAGTINGALKGNGAGVVSQAACADLSNGATGCSTANGTTTDWFADNATKLMVTDQVWTAGAFATITFGATTTIDLSTLINGTVTLTGNITTLNWNNCKAGQTGVIEFIQDGTGSRTVPAAWNSSFRWGGGTRGTLSTAINAVDWLFYQCKSSTVVFVSLQKALAN
jgi:hypothetical protein